MVVLSVAVKIVLKALLICVVHVLRVSDGGTVGATLVIMFMYGL